MIKPATPKHPSTVAMIGAIRTPLGKAPLVSADRYRTGALAMPTESAPLSRAASARFRGMVDAHFQFIWRMLRGLGVGEPNVDDAAQQVFLVASNKLESITEGSERSFLFGTALGVAANVRRAQARDRERIDDADFHERPDDRPNPEQVAEGRQARALLERFLDALPIELRTVFVLFELEGLTTAEIAELLDLPPGTAASRLRRAREEFQANVKRFQAQSQRGGQP